MYNSSWKNANVILSFYLGEFLRKSADDHYSASTISNIIMFTQPFTMGVDWPESRLLMDYVSRFHILRFYFARSTYVSHLSNLHVQYLSVIGCVIVVNTYYIIHSYLFYSVTVFWVFQQWKIQYVHKGPVIRVPHTPTHEKRMLLFRWYLSEMRFMPVWSFDWTIIIRLFA